MSTGAWIFAGLVSAAVIAPATVYAATITKVALVGSDGTTAGVTPQHQLLTVPIGPSKVVHAVKVVHSGCTVVYSPPAGKAIVVTSVVYNFGSGTQGTEVFGGMFGPGCTAANQVDQIDQIDKFGSVEHTFPTGVPLANVSFTSSGSDLAVFVVGYLIDATSLPAASLSHVSGTTKAMSAAG
jgi:hypothetical protein